jgi:multiple antibiotic resistance protein
VTAYAIRTFLTLLVVMDPVGLGPVFLGLAGNRPAAERVRLATRAVIIAGGVLFLFAVAGTALLRHLHISLDAFRVAGGILLFRIAVDMVFAQLERETEEEELEARSRRDISVFPLAIPLIAGPGALASVMILAGEARGLPWGLGVLLATGALVLAIVYLGLRLSDRTARLLGQTGVNVVTRVLGVLLAALAVQYVADGVGGLLALRAAANPSKI